MKKITPLLIAGLMFSAMFSVSQLMANEKSVAENKTYTASSPAYQAVLLELYTSEGCSSCPPADKWVTQLKQAGYTGEKVVPLVFHVTYWDYIGWKDLYANKKYDDRQRVVARHNRSNTIYTPQFVFNGDDYRNHGQFTADVSKINTVPASVDLKITAKVNDNFEANVQLDADVSGSKVKDVAVFLAVYENNLFSNIEAGENRGEGLHHDFVVRKLYGPFIHSLPENKGSIEKTITFHKSWKRSDLGLVAFAQNPHTGEILQAVNLKF